jgi:hypothetical protein
MTRFKDMTGQKFSRLSIVECLERGSVAIKWRCVCDCGNETIVAGQSLRRGKSRSCGCLAKEAATTHGRSRTVEHRCWVSMNSRCSSETNQSYENYGGRGIKVCERWQESFENFYADMGDRPAGHSIERIDNNGNYDPGNCRWATTLEQCQNLRITKYVVIDGKRMTITQAARAAGIKKHTAFSRIKRGMDPVRALTLPVRRYA